MAEASEPVAERVDTRILRTRESLRAAVLELAADRDWSEISITDLTRHARVSRPTFYLHYASLDELAADALIERMRELTGSEHDVTAGAAGVPDWLVNFLTELNADRAVYRRLLGARSVAGIAREMVAERLVERVLRSRGEAVTGAEEFAQFLAGGILGFLAYWLRPVEVESAEMVREAAERLWELIRRLSA
ncbi:TetR family transcriptional regulator [Nocardia sp. NPDC047038]|uniref:TetR/AcrR family transcriptional regulator n=1 Tax=Nocardia sp. NPDC047038 TaxID=3154338 RepID=UPI0033DC2EFE